MIEEEFSVSSIDEATAKKLLGFWRFFVKGEKREKLIVSRYVKKLIKDRQKAGEILTELEIDKIKFKHDPIFKEKVIEKNRRECDKQYKSNIRICENQLHDLEKSKKKEMKRIENSRWENVVRRKLRYNMTEGKFEINETCFPFSAIKGAGVNVVESYRMESTEKGHSKKHVSVGGAMLGGLMFGDVGAIIGGTTLGKTTYSGTTDTNMIPTVAHVGVIVDIDGFRHEIILLTQMVDRDSEEFEEAIEKAQKIITKLQYLSTVPVPETFVKVEDEYSVVQLTGQIAKAQENLQAAIKNVPTYEIPERYL